MLVCHASRHGATTGIAERIAERIGTTGVADDRLPIDAVNEVDTHDAFVIGAPAYMFDRMKDATRFVKRHRSIA